MMTTRCFGLPINHEGHEDHENHEHFCGFQHERGSALIGVLLLLMMMSALVAALAVSGRTETFISRNQYSGAQAHAAAEAGLNHAVELVTSYIFEWKDCYGTPEEAVSFLLVGPDFQSGFEGTDADNRSLGARDCNGDGIWEIEESEAIPLGTRLEIAGGIVADDRPCSRCYKAIIMDDDTAPGEDGVATNDNNQRLIIQATGYGPDNTLVVLEAVISPIPLPAVVANGDLDVSGSVSIAGAGTMGSVHANGDLTMGDSVSVAGTATASGEFVPEAEDTPGSGGAARLPVQRILASDYKAHADFILTAAGTMVDTAYPEAPPRTWAPGVCCNNWDFDSSTGAWNITGAAAPTGTYYVEGRVNITSSPATPVNITIIAKGSINISGSPNFIPDTEGYLFVTDADLDISGGLTALTLAGQMLVHEQVKLSGSPALAGQLLVENAPSGDDSLFDTNEISGNVTITYNGGLGTGVYSVTGWRDVRQ